MIDEYEAEAAIQDLANRLPEESDEMVGIMVDCNAVAPDASIVDHREWRGTGGIPHFCATIHYKGEGGDHLIGGDYIEVKVKGIFKQARSGLSVIEYHFEECRVVDPRERYVRPYCKGPVPIEDTSIPTVDACGFNDYSSW